MNEVTGQQAAGAADRFAAAHRALRADPTIQFTMRPPDPPKPPPQWLVDLGRWISKILRPVARLFDRISALMPDLPYVRVLLWAVIAVLAVAALWMAYQRIRHGEWRWPRRRRRQVADAIEHEEKGWVPDAAPAREWLAEADRLAAAGRFAEAVHHLLFRSVEDMARRRPAAVRPALTSRELARAEALPGVARELFARIARLVETSLFGRRDVTAEQWHDARAAYESFALPGTWRR